MSTEYPAKAVLYRLEEVRGGTADKPPTVRPSGDPIPVQFNPTSLKVDRNNDVSGSSGTQGQRRQRTNEGHATLTLDLEFDSAEGDADGSPLDVRTLTQRVRQFVEPPADSPQDAPPRLRFIWGTFVFDGTATRVGEEIDYFAADGTALRAKVSLSVTEQNLEFEANTLGPGARTDTSATAPGGSGGGGPGSGPSGRPDRAVDALDGESVQQALSRLGLDPATWRSAMAGLGTPLGLTAGAQLQVDASASAGAGIGASAGFGAGLAVGGSAGASAGVSAAASAGASAGMSARATAGAGASFGAGAIGASGSGGAVAGGAVGASAQASAGFALSAVGGVEAAAQGVLAAEAESGVSAARGSFAVPGAAGAGARASASVAASAGVGARAAAGARAGVDGRATGYGRGVPLKPPATVR